QRRQDLDAKVQHFRSSLNKMGFRVIKSSHPIVGIASHDAVKTQRIIDSLYKDQVFAIGLCYPVVPKGFARIRAHITASHSQAQLDQALEAFARAGKKHKILR
ncbi:MAG: aminotransferase class I/II-fold pyridoxal phosphate-dependent enzyme, partial [Bdellovibrionales bacterium]|nr:aminotransferase class I/II-fold pyridoxal phosphate-dependent enzyme [Bdellovibrionales bacterium]